MYIEIKDLTFKYNKKSNEIIKDLSLSLDKGKIVALLGLNGCGKTTLIKLLTGLLKPNQGTIEYDGVNLEEIGIKVRSDIFSYVSQRSSSADDFYVKHYMINGFMNSLKFYEQPKKEQKEKVFVISRELGIEHLLDKKMGEISGGERQIVTIATCILQNTPVILLDEPTSALDLKNQNLVLSLLKKISIKDKKTIIFSTHNPNHALFVGGDVALMDGGKIISYGASCDLIKKYVLKSIYGENICYCDEQPYKEISYKAKKFGEE